MINNGDNDDDQKLVRCHLKRQLEQRSSSPMNREKVNLIIFARLIDLSSICRKNKTNLEKKIKNLQNCLQASVQKKKKYIKM